MSLVLGGHSSIIHVVVVVVVVFFLVFNFFFGLFVCVDFVLEVTIDRLGYDVSTPKTIQFHELGEPAASYR